MYNPVVHEGYRGCQFMIVHGWTQCQINIIDFTNDDRPIEPPAINAPTQEEAISKAKAFVDAMRAT